MNIKSVVMNTNVNEEDIFSIYVNILENNPKAFIAQIEDKFFIYKTLGRNDYRLLVQNTSLTVLEKEEFICEQTVLYPEKFDFETCEAGIPTKLCEEILKSSYLGNQEARNNLMQMFRLEMEDIENQITCMIQEAFPNLRLEEIENMDMETTLKYLAKAEWILINFRNAKTLSDPFSGEILHANIPEEYQQEAQAYQPQQRFTSAAPEQGQEEDHGSFIPGESVEDRIRRVQEGKIKPPKLTPEKLRELQQMHPEIDWSSKATENDFKVQVDTTPMALREN